MTSRPQSSTPEVPPLPASAVTRPQDAKPIVDPDLKAAVATYNEMARRNELAMLPTDLPTEQVRAHLQSHVDEELAHGAATTAQAAAIKKRDKATKACKAIQPQLVDAINGAYPPGTPERGSFFPAGPGDRSLGEHMQAIVAGMTKHPLPSLPKELTLAFVVDTTRELALAENAAAAAKSGKESSATARINLEPRTTAIASRLARLVRSRHGRSSKELAAYGLKVQIAPASRKKPARKVTTAPTPEPVPEPENGKG